MSLARNTLVQSSLTLTSRIFGFARDVLLAAKIGAGPIGDAWATALMFPNLFRRIFAEGAFSQAFVPSYARTLEESGPEAARQVADEALRALFAITAAITIAAQLAMPWLMLIFHAGYSDDTPNFNLAVLLTQITMPYLACVSIAALLSGVLNSLGRFVLSAGAPILLNIALIGAALIGDTPDETARIAAIAVVIGGVSQALLLYWGVQRQDVRLSILGLPKITPNVRHIFALAVPGTIAASGTQINIMVSQLLASFEEGAKSWLYYADRLYQLPLGLVGVAVGVAILPRLSRAARRDDQREGQTMMDEGIGLAMALTLPAAAALFLLPTFLIDGIFARGAFTSTDAERASLALVHYAWGVPAFVLIKVLAPAFFAREDMTTPMRFSLASVAINTALGAGLFFWLQSQERLGFPGLAIATSVAAWTNAVLLAVTLAARDWYRPGRVLLGRLLRAGFATLAMSGALLSLQLNPDLIFVYLPDSRLLGTLCIILIGMLVYAIAALIFGAIRPSELRRVLSRT
ncbi:MAG: murein biosynthesis integral membrane protein MurJ [Pseudomonadota bacterium]